MTPASNTPPSPTTDTSLNTAAQAAVAAIGASAPELPTLHERPATASLLSIKLKVPQTSCEADAGNTAAPRSPSARSRKQGKRSVTESRGQKRAIDGRDGPGLSTTSPPKRQKESSPPVSPRSGSASGKQLVKSPRPVADLKAMVRLSPRRAESASPPVSPRAPATDDQTEASSPHQPGDVHSPSSSTAATSFGSAPRWRSASHGEMPDGLAPSSPRRSPRIGSMAGMPATKQPGTTPTRPDARPAPGNRAKPDAGDTGEFAFFGCEYGEDGILTTAQQDAGTTLGSTPDSLSLTLVTAEVVPVAQAQKDAATAYLRALEGRQQGDTNALRGGARKRGFEAAQTNLETAVMIAEMALSQGDWNDVMGSLKGILGALASCRTSFMALAGSAYGKQAGEAMAGPQDAVTACMQSLENACTFGLELLADQLASHAGAASTASTTEQARLVLTQSAEQLLDDVDLLMNEEIKVAAPVTRSKRPRKQQ